MKKFFIGFLLLCILINLALAEKSKIILMIIASQNFRDEELLKPKEIFEKKGFKVTIASSSLHTATGMLGAKVKPDLLINNVNIKNYDAVVFVGGTGATEYFNNSVALKIAQEAVKQNKVVAAICIAPRILAEAGVLQNRKATVWSSEASALKAKGAIYTGQDVTVDGKIVTASGPHAAEAFAIAILKLLK
ncbi:MAG: DJ-1/PfpI family protein [Thermodesulfovibrio sp.]|jgi:protease I|uniref:DJ-1 family protein n=2 Tax=Thermodesulfovibrio TaxID=28261 RepID=A0A2J6WPZ0_9BACT|nr:MAG: DJ-1 family protein [Thermodesulfovibrio aggregans]